MTPYLAADGPIVLAHRGYSAAHPENSMAAFAAAVDLGCRYVETDVHATADGVLIAFHDDSLDRVTDSYGKIADLTWAEVSHARISGTEPVPRFDEVLAAWPELRVNVDVKSAAAVTPLALAIERARVHDRVCVGSFSGRRRTGVLRRLTRPVCTSASTERMAMIVAAVRAGTPTRALFHGIDCLQIPLRHRGIPVYSEGLLAAAHAAGVQVHVWTIDDDATMDTLLTAGVDGLVTNRPDVALRAVERHRLAALPVLDGSRNVRLVPFDPDTAQPSVLAETLSWYQDPDTVRLVDGPEATVYDQDKLLRMYRNLRDRGELYLIQERAGNDWVPVGDVTLSRAAMPIVLAPGARGRGIGRTTLRALIHRAQSLGWESLNVSDIYAYNDASQNLFAGLGFLRGEPTEHGHRWSLDITPR